jgi:hypothetical protein
MPRSKVSRSDVLPVTPANILNSLLSLDKRTKKKVDDLNGELREAIAGAVRTKHLHVGAFKTIKRMQRLEDSALAEEYYHLMAYLDSSGITDRVDAVGRLPLGDENVVELREEAVG